MSEWASSILRARVVAGDRQPRPLCARNFVVVADILVQIKQYMHLYESMELTRAVSVCDARSLFVESDAVC